MNTNKFIDKLHYQIMETHLYCPNLCTLFHHSFKPCSLTQCSPTQCSPTQFDQLFTTTMAHFVIFISCSFGTKLFIFKSTFVPTTKGVPFEGFHPKFMVQLKLLILSLGLTQAPYWVFHQLVKLI